MGIYQIDMVVQNDFPITMAKVAIWVQYFEERDALSDDLKLSIWVPGKDDPFFFAELSRDELKVPPYPYDVPEAQRDRLMNVVLPVIFSPLVIPQPGFIRVEMQCGSLTTRIGRLMVRKARPDEAAQFSTFPSNASVPPPSQSPTAS
ncbi:MAG: hypothetical protein WDO17_14790 [Alphaproteobacteria bacterium]